MTAPPPRVPIPETLAPTVLDALSEGVVVQVGQGAIIWANASAERLLGLTLAQLQGRRFMDPRWAAIRADGSAFPSEDHPAMRALRNAELTLSARLVASPDAPQATLVLSDVTDVRSAESSWLTDPLTQVRNRRGLDQALGAAVAEGRPFALLFIDLDRFKPINDHHGHAVGDAVLARIAQRLQGQLRPGDTLARFGGDEFVALIRQVRTTSASQAAARRLVSACAAPIQLNGLKLQVGASIGLARFPADGRTPDVLLDVADAAMLAVKRRLHGANRRGWSTGEPEPQR